MARACAYSRARARARTRGDACTRTRTSEAKYFPAMRFVQGSIHIGRQHSFRRVSSVK